jgi:hypothetical protein
MTGKTTAWYLSVRDETWHILSAQQWQDDAYWRALDRDLEKAFGPEPYIPLFRIEGERLHCWLSTEREPTAAIPAPEAGPRKKGRPFKVPPEWLQQALADIEAEGDVHRYNSNAALAKELRRRWRGRGMAPKQNTIARALAGMRKNASTKAA